MDQKVEPQPNPYWKRNLDAFKAMLKVYFFYEKRNAGDCEYKVCDYDPLTGIIKEIPRYIGFYWSETKGKFGRNVSLHQSPHEFDQELGKVFAHLFALKLIGRYDKNGKVPNDSFAGFEPT